MDNYLADYNGTTYGGILAAATEKNTARVIETQMLDGSFTVQTIGSPSPKLDVEYYGSTATRRLLETATAESAPVVVYWKDKVYTGLISGGQIAYERWSRNKTELAEKVTFTLLVTGVVDR